MSTDLIHIIGAGGHARVVVDALLSGGTALANIAVLTEDEGQVGVDFCGMRIRKLDPESLKDLYFHLGIGNNYARARLHGQLLEHGAIARTIIHPSAVIAMDVLLGAGSFVAAGAIIGPKSSIGVSTILNHGSIVDHDCDVGEFSHVAPGTTLTGSVKIGSRVLVGAGAIILPGVAIGGGSIVGAGAMVNEDMAPDSVYVGIPAKRIR